MAITLNSNIQKIWKALINAGCTKQGAAGIMGNLYSQSKCNPTCVEGLLLKRYQEDGKIDFPYGLYDQKNYDLYVSRIDSGAMSKEEFLSPRSYTGQTYQYGFGLCQWTSRGRKTNLWSYTKGKNKSIANIQGQINYLVYELKNMFPSVWNIVSNTKSIDQASDIVLTKFEQPADPENWKQIRRTYGKEFYELCKNLTQGKESAMSVNFNDYFNKISNSGHDENGRYTNGVAGDQDGEWVICDWYQYPFDGGWLCVLRHPSQQVRNILAELSIQAANNNNIGYDQNERYTYWNQLQSVGYWPANITSKCEADCSAGVIANTKATGYLLNSKTLQNVNASYTGNMRAGFSAAGFQVLTDAKYLNSSDYLLPGDILLNDQDHTAVNLGYGRFAGSGAPTEELGANYTKTSTKTIQNMLKKIGWSDLKADGDYGSLTTKAVKEFQEFYDLSVDGNVGEETLPVLKAVYQIVKNGFNAKIYSDNYADLKKFFGTDFKELLRHYYEYGKDQGREAFKVLEVQPTPKTIEINTTDNYNKTKKATGKVTAGKLRVRRGPGINYGLVRDNPYILRGVKLAICDAIKKNNDSITWYYIKLANSKYGFVNSDYVKII